MQFYKLLQKWRVKILYICLWKSKHKNYFHSFLKLFIYSAMSITVFETKIMTKRQRKNITRIRKLYLVTLISLLFSVERRLGYRHMFGCVLILNFYFSFLMIFILFLDYGSQTIYAIVCRHYFYISNNFL